MTRGLRLLLGVFAVLAIVLLALTSERVAERGRFARAFSSYGSGPSGVRALYLLLHELGFTTVRWSQDLARLPAHATLVALGDCDTRPARSLSRYEREELSSWVKKGGVLLVAGARNYLPSELPVSFELDTDCQGSIADDEADAPEDDTPDAGVPPMAATPPRLPSSALDGGASAGDAGASTAPAADGGVDEVSSSDQPTWGIPMSPVLQGLPIVPFRSPGRLKLQEGSPADTLIGAPDGDSQASGEGFTPLAVVVRHGLGRVIVLASANMLQNVDIESSAGATLFSRLLKAYGGSGPVLFDEYHLGVGERRSLMQYLRQLGAMPALCQLLLCVSVLLWRAGARFGSVRTNDEPTQRGTISFVTALGSLYQAAGDAGGAVRLIARAALARIAAHHGLDSMQAAALDKALGERNATAAQAAVRSIVAAVSSTRSEPLPTRIQHIDAAVARALADAEPADKDARMPAKAVPPPGRS